MLTRELVHKCSQRPGVGRTGVPSSREEAHEACDAEGRRALTRITTLNPETTRLRARSQTHKIMRGKALSARVAERPLDRGRKISDGSELGPGDRRTRRDGAGKRRDGMTTGHRSVINQTVEKCRCRVGAATSLGRGLGLDT